jgi:Ca-activated chloride channel homolog
MSDHDLERLKDVPVPPARAEAKARALAAAKAAFAGSASNAPVGWVNPGRAEREPEATQQSTAEQVMLGRAKSLTQPTENSATSSQGSETTARPTHASPNRRTSMRVPKTYAMAASIAALCVAAPAALYLLKPRTDDARTIKVAREATPRPNETVIAAVPVPETVATRVEPAKVANPDAASAAKPATNMPAATEAYGNVDALKKKDEGEIKSTLQARERDGKPPARANEQVEVRRQATAPVPVPVPGMAMAGAPAKIANERIASAPPPPPALATGRAQVLLVPSQMASEKSRLGGQVASILPPSSPRDAIAQPQVEHGRDKFEAKESNPVKQVTAEPVSTFSIDVDTASYSIVRRSLNGGRLPPKDAVRVEEMVNYFPYDYAKPDSAAEPFRANVQVFPSPWKAGNQLVHIGLKGYDIKSAERPRANLVLLVDISGSMGPADRLPLVKNAFRMLIENLKPDDTVSIVTYASGSDVRLQPTKVAEKAKVIAAIDSLNAGGSTAGAAGITDAYKVAEANFDKGGVNRVILATDGDWNVGITNRSELKGFIERKRETGIFLSILGVGMGNHNDALMQTLAQSGNGAAAYIDTLNEARKVLVDEASSTLFPIAKDVKIQLEFNPAVVSEYRLIGYETRMLRREDFNNDKVDAGDAGSGHSVTAIYEITPVGAPKIADDLRYQPQPAAAPPRVQATDEKKAEIGFLKLRYKLPKEDASRLVTFVVGPEQTKTSVGEASNEARFSTAVAAFAQMLRGLPYMQGYSYDDVIALANSAKGEDAFGYRAEFVNLVRLAKSASASVSPQ